VLDDLIAAIHPPDAAATRAARDRQLITHRAERADRRQDRRHDDYLRFIDERKAAYADWSVAARDTLHALLRSFVHRDGTAGPQSDEDADHIAAAVNAVRAVNGRIRVISNRDVREVVEDFSQLVNRLQGNDVDGKEQVPDVILKAEQAFRDDLRIED